MASLNRTAPHFGMFGFDDIEIDIEFGGMCDLNISCVAIDLQCAVSNQTLPKVVQCLKVSWYLSSCGIAVLRQSFLCESRDMRSATPTNSFMTGTFHCIATHISLLRSLAAAHTSHVYSAMMIVDTLFSKAKCPEVMLSQICAKL